MARTTMKIIMLPTLALYATILFLSPKISNAKFQPPLFVIGDSLFDSGMTSFNGIEGSGAQFWPYGDTYFERPMGRYCDGRIIPDFIAQFAGLPLNRPYLLPGINSFTKGVSFASAGACVLADIRPGTMNLAVQMQYFVDMVKRLKQQVGDVKADKLLSQGVFIFNIGGNDLITFFEMHKYDLPLSPSTKKDFINQLMGNLTAHIHTIYNQGGRKFAFLNMGPMGCMPSVKFILGVNTICADEPQELSRMYNIEFGALASRLKLHLPEFTYTIYDLYNSLHQRILHGNKFGFKETQIACCGSGPFNGDYTCKKMDHSFSVCSIPGDYVWFDAGHFSEKANEQLAKEMWDGGPNVIAPYNLRTLFSMGTRSVKALRPKQQSQQ